MNESNEHEENLNFHIKDLRLKGFNVVKTGRKLPDAIATKDGKLYAIEVIGIEGTLGGNESKRKESEKRATYGMYDDLLFFEFKKELNKKQKSRLRKTNVWDRNGVFLDDNNKLVFPKTKKGKGSL